MYGCGAPRTILGYALENYSLKVWLGGGVEEIRKLAKKLQIGLNLLLKKQQRTGYTTL